MLGRTSVCELAENCKAFGTRQQCGAPRRTGMIFASDSATIYMKGSSIMALMSIPKFERLFREAASLDVDKEDLRRYEEFIAHKTHDLLLLG
jgi:hypothetical protein